MDDTVGIALIGDHAGKLVGDPQLAFRLGQQHYAAVRGDSPAIEAGADLLAGHCWQVKR